MLAGMYFRNSIFKLCQKKDVIPFSHRNFCASISDKEFVYDLVVIGGGIVGVAAARQIALKFPKLQTALVEKEFHLAKHQSGHNSGVIHAGVYYTPGSLKATLCVRGMKLMYEYLCKNSILYKKPGKLIVATEKHEIPALMNLYERAQMNGVEVNLLCKDGIRKIEPHCNGLQAIHSPETGIVNFAEVTKCMGDDFKANGGKIYTNFEVCKFTESESPRYPVKIVAKDGRIISAKFALCCAGLQSDLVARMSGRNRNPAIVPIRGEYLVLKDEFASLVNGNIYPVPNPHLPFLGVHFTKRMDGSVWLGPNAVLAFRREGYKWGDIKFKELSATLSNLGFLKLALKYSTFGINEVWKSISIEHQVKDAQRFVNCLRVENVLRGPAGVRAQALSNNGELIDDFYFELGEDMPGKFILHCRNAPSPGATSSLAIAEYICDKMNEYFNLGAWKN